MTAKYKRFTANWLCCYALSFCYFCLLYIASPVRCEEIVFFENKLYNASGFNSIQATINANDAICIYFLERISSSDHREAIRLHVDVVNIINDSSQRRRISYVLEKRAEVGYLGKPISRNTAEKLLKDAIIFTEWVKKYIK